MRSARGCCGGHACDLRCGSVLVLRRAAPMKFRGKGRAGPRKKELPPGKRVLLGHVVHMCGASAVARVACDGVPLPGTPLFAESGERVGAVDEVLGPMCSVHVSFVPAKRTCGCGAKLLAPETRILPAERFLSRSEAIAEKERHDRTRAKTKREARA